MTMDNKMPTDSTEVKIWSRFERKLQSGETVKLKILSAPKEMSADVVEFMTKFFIHEEIWTKTCEVGQNPKAIEEYTMFLLGVVKTQPTLLCCLDNGDDSEDRPLQIVGCNCLYLSKQNEKHGLTSETEELKKLFGLLEEYEKYTTTVYDKYGVNEYLTGVGLSVDPKYRGAGIGLELLKARRPLCEELGIAVTGASFTGFASQRAADKAGYEVVVEVDYKTFGEQCGVTFITQAPSFKIQMIKY